MNGIGLLVLIAAAGQISATPQIAPNRDFGWEIDQQNPDRALCYIVQVSREVAATMERDSYEKTSNLPPELVGRATRIVFRIGNETLPQNPSLEELRNMPLVNSTANVTAQLGGGRMADVEPNAVVTVQQDRAGAPRLPAFPDQSSASAPQPRTDFADRLQPGAENNIVDQAKNLSRGTSGVPNASGRDNGNSPPMPDYSTTGNASRLGGSPLDNNSNNWQGSPSTLGGNSGGDRSRDTENRFGNQNTVGPTGNYGNNNGGINPTSGYGLNGNNPNYGSPNPPSLGPPELFTGIPSSQTPSGGFGNYLSNQGQGKFNSGTPGFNNDSGQNQTASGQFPQGGQVFGDGRYPPTSNPAQGSNSQYTGNGQAGFDNFDRIASNTPVGGGHNTSLPPPNSDLSGQGASRPGAAGGAVRDNSASDASNNHQAGLTKSTTLENILPAFFILSLLVNFYLGSLIRKLLTRYRALLANMRGQTSPNVLSA